MRKRALLLVVVVALLGTGAKCGSDDVKIAEGALQDFRSSTHLTVPESITLHEDDVTLLAGQAGVSESVIRDVAPQLDSEPLWKSSMTRLREIYEQVPDDIRSGSISIVCGVIRGDITSDEELIDAINDEFGPRTQAEWAEVGQSLVGYANDMYTALQTGDEEAASVTLTCFIAEYSS